MHLRSFLKVNVQHGDIFWVAKISTIYLGIPDIPDILVKNRCWIQVTYEEKMRVPPWDINIPHFHVIFSCSVSVYRRVI